MNADDDLSTGCAYDANGGKCGQPSTLAQRRARHAPDATRTASYGGAGRDVLIGNTGGDRLIDWVGEFNCYLVPFAPFGIATVSRKVPPALFEFLYALSKAQGVDRPAQPDTDATSARRGTASPTASSASSAEGLRPWQDQTGGPTDPQAGNIPGGQRDVLRTANFNDGTLQGFAADSGVWQVTGAALQVAAASLGQDAAAVFYVDQTLPTYYEVLASISVSKPTAGWKANAYIIFDYFSPTDFKFAGIDVGAQQARDRAPRRRRAGSSTRRASSPAASGPTPTTTCRWS